MGVCGCVVVRGCELPQRSATLPYAGKCEGQWSFCTGRGPGAKSRRGLMGRSEPMPGLNLEVALWEDQLEAQS